MKVGKRWYWLKSQEKMVMMEYDARMASKMYYARA
jgi:hypothetical protein